MTDSYTQAMDEIRARIKASKTSFGAGMAFLPKEKREAMFALYAFCREVDDIADDSPTREASQQGLQQWRGKIHALFQNNNPVQTNNIGTGLLRAPHDALAMTDSLSDSIVQTLFVALQRFPLVESDFQAIIDGMAMDADGPLVAPPFATLDLYCDRVASAVGRASVRIFGDSSDHGLRVAHHLGRALQLTNILRDLAEDAARGRLYVPEELLNKHGLITRKPEEVICDPNLPAVCRDLAAKAHQHFIAAQGAMRFCNRSVMRPARIMGAYYGAILDKLRAEDWRNVFLRIRLTKARKLLLIIKSFF